MDSTISIRGGFMVNFSYIFIETILRESRDRCRQTRSTER